MPTANKNDNLISPNESYSLMYPELKKVRDCVLGQFFVKEEGETHLPHPSDLDTTSAAQSKRYNSYLRRASFIEVPGQTKKSVIGKLNADESTIELPDQITYLENDVDKDGLSMVGLIESIAGEQLEVKWCVQVSDYQGLTDVDVDQLSVADIEALNPRATINQYTRENVIDWAFSRINGRMQLVYILLREELEEFDYNQSATSAKRTEVESYLKLALDEEGYYYQQKLVGGAGSGGFEEGERNYISVSKEPLKFLPVEIVSDEEFTGSDMPLQLGYLSGICDLTLERYQNDADYKEMMHKLQPTTYVTGVDSSFTEQFPGMNNGRTYVAVGDVNVLPGSSASDVKIEVLSAQDHTGAFERFKAQNEKEIRALGGIFPSDELRQRTATETMVESANMTAMLNPMVTALEQGLTRSIAYCAMLEGLVAPNDIDTWAADNITVDLPREFATNKMGVEERQQLLNEYQTKAITKATYLRLLDEGGVVPDWEEELAALELEPPRLTGQTSASNIETER